VALSAYAGIVALALAAGGGFVAGARWVTANWNADRLDQAQASLESERLARRADTARNERVTEALNANDRKARAARAAAAAAGDELGRLRDALAAAGTPADPEAAGRADDAARARYVVRACAAELRHVAEAADACETQLTWLQDWVKAVTEEPAP
jgi:hypothetical protein